MNNRPFASWFCLGILSLILCSCGGGGGGDSEPPLSSNACDALGLETRVINGTQCVSSSAAVVPITLVNAQNSVSACSGTVIASRYVLTAAHCFLFDDIVAASVEVGGRSVPSTEVFVHPDASVDETRLVVFNDVAILKLSRTANISAIPLLLSRALVESDIFSIFGYGLDDTGTLGELRSGQMRATTVTTNHIFSRFAGTGSNTCSGDSGGPAIFSYTDIAGQRVTGIVGITSSGSLEDCSKGDLSAFANAQTPSIFDFIMAVVPDVGVV